MLFKRTRARRRAAFAGFAAILGLGSTLGLVGGVFAGSPSGAATATCTTVGLGISIKATVFEVTNPTVMALTSALARSGDKIIYTLKVDIPTGDCHPFKTGIVKLTLPNGMVKTLATGVTLTPGVATGTPKSFRLPTATAYVVSTTDIHTHTAKVGSIHAHGFATGKETHRSTLQTVTANTNLTIRVIHPETVLTKSVTKETPATGTVPTTVKFKFTEKNVSTTVDPTATTATFETADSLHGVTLTDTGTGCTPVFKTSSTPTHSTPKKTSPTNLLLPGVTWTYTCTATYTTVGTKTDTAKATSTAGDTRPAGTVTSKGDPHSETSTLTVKVSPATPKLATKATATTATVPGKVKDTVTISAGDKPKGSVVVKVYKTATCTGTLVTSKQVTFTTDGTFSTGTLTAPTAATYYFEVLVATSAVTANNKVTTLKSACGAPTETAKVGPATPKLATKATATTATVPGKVKDTVTISAGDKPKGSVVVKVYKTATCTGTLVTSKKVTFTTDGTFSTGTLTAPTAATYYFEVLVATSAVTANNKVTTLKSACGAPTETAVVAGSPKFSVAKSDVPGNTKPVIPGQTIPYTVTVTNIGTAKGPAKLTDTLPSNVFTARTATCPAGCTATIAAGKLTISITTLAVGAHETVTFKAKVKTTDKTSVKNTVTFTTTTPCSICTATVTNPVLVFSVAKTDVPGNGNKVKAGQTIPYTVTVTNVGTSKGPAKLTDTLPSNVVTARTAVCSPTTGCTATIAAGKLTISITTLAVGAHVTVTFKAKVKTTDTTNVLNTVSFTTTTPCSICKATVTNPLTVPVNLTLTPGFWKNHKTATSPLLKHTPLKTTQPMHLGNFTVKTFTKTVSGVTVGAKGILSDTGCKTTGINCLAVQFLAAKLNLGNNTNGCIVTLMKTATAFLKTVGYNGPRTYTVTSAQAAEAKTLDTKFSKYNSDNKGTCTALGI